MKKSKSEKCGCCCCGKDGLLAIVAGGLLVAFGVLLALQSLGPIPLSLEALPRLWPLLLSAVGILVIVKHAGQFDKK